MRAHTLTRLKLRAINNKRLLFLLFLASSIALSAQAAQAEEINDPWESANRQIFLFNDKFDTYFFEPLARGYKFVVPKFLRTGIKNVIENLKYPQYALSDVVQGKGAQLGDHTARFLINTTLGLAGIMDPADDLGFKRHYEDFGISLAYHGVCSGPYMVIPFLGPSTVRDSFGRFIDISTDPLYYLQLSSNVNDSTKNAVSFSGKALEAITARVDLLEAVKAAKESSLDYYAFTRKSYYQHRLGVLYDGKVPESEDIDETEEEE